MKKALILGAVALTIAGQAAVSEARTYVSFGLGFFPFFPVPVVHYVAAPPAERVEVYRDDSPRCRKVEKTIYDSDGNVVKKRVREVCEETSYKPRHERRDADRDDD